MSTVKAKKPYKVKGVKLTWDKVAGAESYVIYRKVSDGSWKSIETVSSSKTSTLETRGKKERIKSKLSRRNNKN